MARYFEHVFPYFFHPVLWLFQVPHHRNLCRIFKGSHLKNKIVRWNVRCECRTRFSWSQSWILRIPSCSSEGLPLHFKALGERDPGEERFRNVFLLIME